MGKVLMILHFIGLAMGVGTSFSFIFLGMAAAKMERNEAKEFMLKAFALGRMGQIGLGLLIFSGLGLMTPYWSSLSNAPLLMAKLALVLVLTILLIVLSLMMKKAKAGEAETYLGKIPKVGRISLLTALTIVSLAVIVFH